MDAAVQALPRNFFGLPSGTKKSPVHALGGLCWSTASTAAAITPHRAAAYSPLPGGRSPGQAGDRQVDAADALQLIDYACRHFEIVGMDFMEVGDSDRAYHGAAAAAAGLFIAAIDAQQQYKDTQRFAR